MSEHEHAPRPAANVTDVVFDALKSDEGCRCNGHLAGRLAAALAEAGIGPVAEAERRGAQRVLAAVETAGAYRLQGVAWDMLKAAQEAARAVARAAAEQAGGEGR